MKQGENVLLLFIRTLWFGKDLGNVWSRYKGGKGTNRQKETIMKKKKNNKKSRVGKVD